MDRTAQKSFLEDQNGLLQIGSDLQQTIDDKDSIARASSSWFTGLEALLLQDSYTVGTLEFDTVQGHAR